MAYAILVSAGRPGIVSYTLGGSEEFAVLAATFAVTTNFGGTPPYWLDYRDPSGGIIGIQCVAEIDNNIPALLSLTPGSPPPLYVDDSGVTSFPNPNASGSAVFSVPLMEPLPLTPGCTVNAYVSVTPSTWTVVDPIQNLDTVADPHDLHLWVEDTKAIGDGHSQDLLVPYMLVPGPLAAA